MAMPEMIEVSAARWRELEAANAKLGVLTKLAREACDLDIDAAGGSPRAWVDRTVAFRALRCELGAALPSDKEGFEVSRDDFQDRVLESAVSVNVGGIVASAAGMSTAFPRRDLVSTSADYGERAGRLYKEIETRVQELREIVRKKEKNRD